MIVIEVKFNFQNINCKIVNQLGDIALKVLATQFFRNIENLPKREYLMFLDDGTFICFYVYNHIQ